MKYVLEHRVRKWRNNTGMEPQSYWVTEAIAEEEHNTFPSLEEKSKSSSDFSLAYIMPVEIILCSHAVFLLLHLPLYNCLNVANFCQILQGGSGLKGIEFLQVSCRWAAAHLPCLLREGQQFELCSSWIPEHTYKEREATRAPAERKVAKELGRYSGSEFLARKPWAGGKQAAAAVPSETICFMKRLWCSALTSVSELEAPGGSRHLPMGRARSLSLRKARGLAYCISGTVFCYFCFRGR